MYHWIDLDLLNLRTTNGKTDSCIYEGYEAKRCTATLVAGAEARGENKDKVLGSYTVISVLSDKEKTPTLILDIMFDLDPFLPELPKVGISAPIPARYSEISWFGRGPEESYPDRLNAAFLGRYTHRINELEVPYIIPQENGNRSGVRNFSLISKDGTEDNRGDKITVTAEKAVNISVSRYSQKNLWEARHTYDLHDLLTGTEGYYFLNIDITQRGVGTATCGPDTREEYRVRPGLFRVKLYIDISYR
jgi:beta-galactosidase